MDEVTCLSGSSVYRYKAHAHLVDLTRLQGLRTQQKSWPEVLQVPKHCTVHWGWGSQCNRDSTFAMIISCK